MQDNGHVVYLHVDQLKPEAVKKLLELMGEPEDTPVKGKVFLLAVEPIED